jgi:hypothetical protein
LKGDFDGLLDEEFGRRFGLRLAGALRRGFGQRQTLMDSSTGSWREIWMDSLTGIRDATINHHSKKTLSVFKNLSFVCGGFLIENPSRIQEYVLRFLQFACFLEYFLSS